VRGTVGSTLTIQQAIAWNGIHSAVASGNGNMFFQDGGKIKSQSLIETV
jgi:hypothetical protein